MSFFKRTDTGGLSVNTLDLTVLFDELLDIAKDEEEVNWICECLESAIERAEEDKIESF